MKQWSMYVIRHSSSVVFTIEIDYTLVANKNYIKVNVILFWQVLCKHIHSSKKLRVMTAGQIICHYVWHSVVCYDFSAGRYEHCVEYKDRHFNTVLTHATQTDQYSFELTTNLQYKSHHIQKPNVSRHVVYLLLPNPLTPDVKPRMTMKLDRRCSNYIWVINNCIAYQGAFYLRGLTICGSGG